MALFERKNWDPGTIFSNARGAWQEFISSLVMGNGGVLAVPIVPAQSWQTPPIGFVKINVDGALNKHAGCGGMGIVAHNSEGVIVGAALYSLLGSFSPRTIEAMGF